MTPEELAAIRERDVLASFESEDQHQTAADRRALLAHIDAITAAVEGLRRQTAEAAHLDDDAYDAYSAVLALLRGTSQR